MQRTQRLIGGLWATALLGVALITAGTVSSVSAERESALALARETLSHMAVSLAAHAERVFADAEHILLEGNLLLPLLKADEIASRLGTGHGASQREDARPGAAVLLIDADGIVLAPAQMQGQSYADDQLVSAAMASGRPHAMFGPPREGRRTGALVIPAAMAAAPNPNGVAVLYTVIPLAPFLDLFALVRPSGAGAAALFREDGMLMERQPFDREAVGRVFRGEATQAFARANAGTVDIVAHTDQVRRIVAFQRAGGYPFFTLVGAEHATILGDVMRRAQALGTLAALACLLVLAGAAFATRQLRRDARQVAALEASRATLDRVAMVAEQTQASVIVTDREGRTEWVNPAFTRNTGFSLAEMAGRKPGQLLQGPDTDPEAAARISVAVRQGEPFDVEILNYDKARRPAWIKLTGNPVRDASGTITRFIAVQTDITARRLAEARAAEASRLSSLGQLAGGVAHDMNNLLMVISLNLELLAESGLEPGKEAMAQAALAATMRGHDLTKQLLSFAQRAADPSRATDVTALLGTVLPLLSRSMPPGIRLITDLRSSGHCRGDPGTLESAVTNLVVNARDALGGPGQIVVECDRCEVGPEEAVQLTIAAGHYVRITVTDDGPGIPKELLGRVLEPFFTTKQGGQGTGLGLSMAYGFARQAGGTLTIESTQGEGTRVSLFLPVVTSGEADLPEPSAMPESLRGLSALVVDDEPQILSLLDRMLRAAGIEVVLALDPVQAQANLAAARPDVLLADVRLAGAQSGVDVAEAARARWPGLPVIFMTGDPGPHFAARVSSLADIAVLQKPFNRDGLMEALRTAVSARTEPAPLDHV